VPTLFVKCRACGKEFPTPIGEPKADPSGVIISGLKLRCPKCGHVAQYSTSEFHAAASSGGPPAGGLAEAEPNPTSEHEGKQTGAQEKFAGLGIVPPGDRPPQGS
jgi:DNA-directed RNA polymerase subunit RPC12/RpoP